MPNGAERHAINHAEGYDRWRVAMHHRTGVRPRAVDFAMDESFEVDRAPASIQRISVEPELHDIGGRGQRRSDTTCEQEPITNSRMANAHVPKPVDHALVKQDMVRRHQLVDYARGYLQRRHCSVKR